MAVFDDTKPLGDKLLLYPNSIKWENNIPVHGKADQERLDIPKVNRLKMNVHTSLIAFKTTYNR
jgi:hypothetical protein